MVEHKHVEGPTDTRPEAAYDPPEHCQLSRLAAAGHDAAGQALRYLREEGVGAQDGWERRAALTTFMSWFVESYNDTDDGQRPPALVRHWGQSGTRMYFVWMIRQGARVADVRQAHEHLWALAQWGRRKGLLDFDNESAVMKSFPLEYVQDWERLHKAEAAGAA